LFSDTLILSCSCVRDKICIFVHLILAAALISECVKVPYIMSCFFSWNTYSSLHSGKSCVHSVSESFNLSFPESKSELITNTFILFTPVLHVCFAMSIAAKLLFLKCIKLEYIMSKMPIVHRKFTVVGLTGNLLPDI
jgi:hypothetical protein